MAKRIALVGAATALFTNLAAFAPASAGGGACHGAEVTTADLAEVERVIMHGNCFYPTVTRAPTGAQVTWLSKDIALHTVTGAHMRWGNVDELGQGERFTARFSSPGVYPYYCIYHPGMAGAIVVDDAGGADSAVANLSGGSVDEVTALSATTRLRARTPARSAWPFVAGAAIIAGVAGFGFGRRKLRADRWIEERPGVPDV